MRGRIHNIQINTTNINLNSYEIKLKLLPEGSPKIGVTHLSRRPCNANQSRDNGSVSFSRLFSGRKVTSLSLSSGAKAYGCFSNTFVLRSFTDVYALVTKLSARWRYNFEGADI